MYLVQILLPLCDRDRKPFQREAFDLVTAELADCPRSRKRAAQQAC